MFVPAWLPLVAEVNKLWFLLPLVVVISLVYCTSRYESPRRILERSLRLALTIAGCISAILVVLAWLSYGL